MRVVRKALRQVFSAFFFQHLLCRFRWYRRWYGGRWERHWIDICCEDIWLPMSNDPARQWRQWPAYRQPCSLGEPLIEDYPVKDDET